MFYEAVSNQTKLLCSLTTNEIFTFKFFIRRQMVRINYRVLVKTTGHNCSISCRENYSQLLQTDRLLRDLFIIIIIFTVYNSTT